MSSATFITTVISISAFMLASVLGVVFFMSNVLGSRIDDLGAALGGRMGRVENRLDHVEEVVQALREDVAVLKATH